MATEKYANNASSTLNGAINSSATTLVVADASTFPTSGNFRILIDQEIMLVTAVSTNTFTVVRGQEGTTASAHSNGVNVDHVLTKGALDAIRSDDVTTDILINRPSAGTAGRLFYPSDSFIFSYDDGTNWNNFGPIWPIIEPPTTGWTWYDNTAASTNQFTTDTTHGGLVLKGPAQSSLSNNRAIYYRSYPSGTFTLTVGWIFNQSPRVDTTNVVRQGIALLDGDTVANIRTWDINNWYNANGPRIQLLSWGAHVQGVTATGVYVTNMEVVNPIIWFQFNNDGTNWNYNISHDGIHFTNWYSEAKNTGVTPTRIGLFIGTDTENSNFNYSMNVFHWTGVS